MVKIPEQNSPTIAKLFAVYEAKKDEPREHLGASEIGRECDREIWLRWRHALPPSFDGRMKRLFNTGTREETRVISDLRAAGLEVCDFDSSGRQIRFEALAGMFGGSVDGMVRGLVECPEKWHVLEVKTHNEKSFRDLVAKGVQASKPAHYAQMQVYMGLSEVDRAFCVAVNKNTDEIWGERVRFEKKDFDSLMDRAEKIIKRDSAPEKLSQDPSFWICKMCGFHGMCHGHTVAQVNCRTCVHGYANKGWRCGLVDDLTTKPCDQHLHNPDLMSLKKSDKRTEDMEAIFYEKDGKEIAEVSKGAQPTPGIPQYSSMELHEMSLSDDSWVAVGSEAHTKTRDYFGGRFTKNGE